MSSNAPTVAQVANALVCLRDRASPLYDWERAAGVLAAYVEHTNREYPGYFDTTPPPGLVSILERHIKSRGLVDPAVQPIADAAMRIVLSTSVGAYATLLAIRSVSVALSFVALYYSGGETLVPDRGAGAFPPVPDKPKANDVTASDAAVYMNKVNIPILDTPYEKAKDTGKTAAPDPVPRLALALLILEPYLAGTRAAGLMYMMGITHACLPPHGAMLYSPRGWPWPNSFDKADVATWFYPYMKPVVEEVLGQASGSPRAAHWATLWAAYLGVPLSTFMMDYEDVAKVVEYSYADIPLDDVVMRVPRAARMQDWAFFVRRKDHWTTLAMLLVRVPNDQTRHTEGVQALLSRIRHLRDADAPYASALDDALRPVDDTMLAALVTGDAGGAAEEIDDLPAVALSLGQARWPRYMMAIPGGERLRQRVVQRGDVIGVSAARASKLSRTTCLVLLALPIAAFPRIGQLVGAPAPVHVMHELLVAQPTQLRVRVAAFLDAFCWFPVGLALGGDEDHEYLYGGMPLFAVNNQKKGWTWYASIMRYAFVQLLDSDLPLEQRQHTPQQSRVDQATAIAEETRGRVDLCELLQRLPPASILGSRVSLLLDASLDATIHDPAVRRALFLLSSGAREIVAVANQWVHGVVSDPASRAAITERLDRVRAPRAKRAPDAAAASSNSGKRHNA